MGHYWREMDPEGIDVPLDRQAQRMLEISTSFPSTYGKHALDEQGHCHTKDPGDYVGRHRAG